VADGQLDTQAEALQRLDLIRAHAKCALDGVLCGKPRIDVCQSLECILSECKDALASCDVDYNVNTKRLVFKREGKLVRII